MPLKKLKTNKFEKFIKFIGLLFNKKNLVAYIGLNGVMLCAIRRGKVLNKIFISADNQGDIKSYKKFLHKYRHYHISFLLDNPETQLRHEIVPVLQNLVKLNPVESFISENSKKTDIVSYNTYNISYNNGEIWETVIAKSPYVSPYNILLEYVVGQSFKYRGTYFLALEFEGIINYLITKTKNTAHKNDLQIFVAVTKTSDIKICIKHKNNIIDDQVIEYPIDKSEEYILGTIEQEISDKLITYKDYIKSQELKISIIILADEELKKAFATADLQGHNKILLTPRDLKFSKKQAQDKFVDSALVSIFNRCRLYNGYNSQLKSITQLNLIHSVIFKPFLIISFGLIMGISITRYQIYEIDKEIADLNNKHYYLSEEYKDVRDKYPEIEHVGRLAELYSLETLLSKPFPKPGKALENLFSVNVSNIMVKQGVWQISDFWNVNHNEYLINLDVDVEYNGAVADSSDGIKKLNNYFNQLRSTFLDYNTRFNIKNDKIVNLSAKMLVPANVHISKIYEEEE